MISSSIRFRVTLAATVAVVLMLAAATVAVVVLQRRALVNGLDDTLRQRGSDIEALLDNEGWDSLLVAGPEAFSQVIDVDGTVIASSANLVGADPLPVGSPSAPGDRFAVETDVRQVDDDSFRVLSRRLSDGRLVHVGSTYDIVPESTAALLTALMIIAPVLSALLASLVWWLVGRTLRPVDAIRAQVASIGSTELHKRVPVPEADDEIGRLASTMNRMLDRIEASVARQRRFVADASHELRSPLTRMRTIVELDSAAGGSAGDSITAMNEEVIEMQRLVEDLLTIARSDEGALDLKMRPLDLDDIVLRETTRIVERGRIDVDRSAVSAGHVMGDRGHLTRIVRNLLDNAERHATSRVLLALHEKDDDVVLRISDDGPGIPFEDADFVFERFGRLDGTRAASQQTGLGLAIARELAERHYGSLVLVASEVPGAVFELRLPRIR